MNIGLELDDRYRLDAELGRGGMGVVYRAHDTLLDRDVAVKILTAATLTDQARQRLLREARAVASLSHPNVVSIHDAGEAQVPGYEMPLPYIVMEYVEGVSLHDHQPADLAETINIAIQVSAALDHAHSQGVIHRDLKPENILITPDATAMLMDFGLASAGASRLTSEGTILGTVFYLAPELALGVEFDGRADLYALGVLLYELTTGGLPFSADDPVAVISQHLHQAVTPPRSLNPDISKELNNLIVMMLSKDPNDRPASAALVADTLKGVGGEEGIHLPAIDISPILPAFLRDVDQEIGERPIFVARERELNQLDQFLDGMLAGQGGVAFISGGPGRGKSALMDAFSRKAQADHPALIVVQGTCNALTGVGDPYAPFRLVLAMLSGDVEAKWAAGAITRDHATRLWEVLPATAQTLANHGPDLLDVFISGQNLLERISVAVPEQRSLLQSLQELTGRERATPGELEQKALFEQYLEVLCQLASKRPLLIMLDDLQWADTASLNLLFHLGRELSGGRILILGAYRPEEVALRRGGERHPLENVLNEFKRLYGDVWIDLGRTPMAEGRQFVDEILDSEPNHLGVEFSEALYAHTEGHPLFTIELLRVLQERGELVLDETGRWVEGPQLDWSRLPARVEGVIEERIGRLEDELRQTLSIASVEGQDFTAQVVARVKEVDERGLVRQLSGELDKVHRLVGERGVLKVAGHRLYLYCFQHHLFQKYLYNGLGDIEREMLHAEVGAVLEELYGERSEEVAGQLAWHFGEAGEVAKAIHYQLLAGDRARLIYAHQEAIAFYQLAVGYLKDQGNYELAARTLMKLGLTYHTVFDYQRSRRAYDEAFAIRQQEIRERTATIVRAPHSFKLVFMEPPTLDPTLSADETSRFYINNIFSGLVDLGRGYEVTPNIAQSWEISENGCRYIFYLRDDVFWSDGTQVTAADFVYALLRTLNPATGAPQAAVRLFYDVKGARAYHVGEIPDPEQVGVRADEPLTLEVELERPAGYFLHLLTKLIPVPRHVVEAHGEAWIDPANLVSNGPFLLESYKSGKSISLVRNMDYHGRFPGNLQEIELKLNLGSCDALEMYGANEIDIVFLDTETYFARHRYIGEYISEPWPGTYFVGFDTSRPPFDNLRVRRAFAMAVDRQNLADEVLAGYRYAATGGLVPPSMPGHSPGIGLPYDPDQARQELAQAGYPDGHGFPNLEIAWNDVSTLEFLKDQLLSNLNVEITIRVMQWADILNKLYSWNVFILGWNHNYPDPDDFLRTCVRGNLHHWRNEIYDRLLDEARRVTNQDERITLYQEADKILMDEATVIPCMYMGNHILVKPWVRIPGGGTGIWHIKEVIIEPH